MTQSSSLTKQQVAALLKKYIQSQQPTHKQTATGFSIGSTDGSSINVFAATSQKAGSSGVSFR